MRILVVNAGSSTLKLSVLDGERLVEARNLPPVGRPETAAAIEAVVAAAGPLDAVGHRVVHGGTEFSGAARIDDSVRQRIEDLTELAPLHQPKSLAALDAVSRLLPGVPEVACFDTAFHRSMPPAASTYALPAEWRRRWPLRRYGFHGLSHAYAGRRGAQVIGRAPDQLLIVSCHLGAGASVTAIRDGLSVDTTMGFTPLEGLVMATRSGSVDPGLVLWLEERIGLSPAEIADALEHRSGLAGLAGTADMRQVLAAAGAGDADAELALEVYLHRLAGAIAAMTASLGGVDLVVFTGGVGENAPAIRSGAAARLGFLGLEVDGGRNEADGADRNISTPTARVQTVVVAAREDLQIAAEVRRLLGEAPEPGGQ